MYSTTSKATSSSPQLRPSLGARNSARSDQTSTRSIFLIPTTLELPTVVPTRTCPPPDPTRQKTILPSCGYQTHSCHRLPRVQTRTLAYSTRTAGVDYVHSRRSTRSEPQNTMVEAAHAAMHSSGRSIGPTVSRSTKEDQQRRNDPHLTGRRAGFSMEASGVLDRVRTIRSKDR